MFLHPLNRFPQRWKKCPGLRDGCSDGGTNSSSSSEFDRCDTSGVGVSCCAISSVEVEDVDSEKIGCSKGDGSAAGESLVVVGDAKEITVISEFSALEASDASWRGRVKSQLSFGASSESRSSS
jgi:hypothetical protein